MSELLTYLFYIEGLNREVKITAPSEKEARKQLWAGLTSDEMDAVVQFECIDVLSCEE